MDSSISRHTHVSEDADDESNNDENNNDESNNDENHSRSDSTISSTLSIDDTLIFNTPQILGRHIQNINITDDICDHNSTGTTIVHLVLHDEKKSNRKNMNLMEKPITEP